MIQRYGLDNFKYEVSRYWNFSEHNAQLKTVLSIYFERNMYFIKIVIKNTYWQGFQLKSKILYS